MLWRPEGPTFFSGDWHAYSKTQRTVRAPEQPTPSCKTRRTKSCHLKTYYQANEIEMLNTNAEENRPRSDSGLMGSWPMTEVPGGWWWCSGGAQWQLSVRVTLGGCGAACCYPKCLSNTLKAFLTHTCRNIPQHTHTQKNEGHTWYYTKKVIKIQEWRKL